MMTLIGAVNNLPLQICICPQERLDNLTRYTMRTVHTTVCTGLFERHRLPFSLLLAAAVAKTRGQLDSDTWRFFLQGRTLPTTNAAPPKPTSQIVTSQIWKDVCDLAASAPAFAQLPASMQSDVQAWEQFATAAEPWTQAPPPPEESERRWLPFERLLLIQALQPHRLQPAVEVGFCHGIHCEPRMHLGDFQGVPSHGCVAA
jgi:hypothetical protein